MGLFTSRRRREEEEARRRAADEERRRAEAARREREARMAQWRADRTEAIARLHFGGRDPLLAGAEDKLMARFTFRLPDGTKRTVSARTEKLARQHLTSLLVHPDPTGTGDGWTEQQLKDAEARRHHFSDSLRLIR